MKLPFALLCNFCLMISCGKGNENSVEHKPSPLSKTVTQKGSMGDPFDGFLSKAHSHAYLKQISPTDSMWRDKKPWPTYSKNGDYTYTEGYLLYLDSNRIGFVTLTCDRWSYGFCNTVLAYPHPDEVRISEAITGVGKKFDGFRIVREIKGGEATDYLLKYDETGPFLYLSSPCTTRPPVSYSEALKYLTEHERTMFRFDYKN